MCKKRHLAFEKRALNIRRGVRPHPTQPIHLPPPRYATGKTQFKSTFKLDISNYTITRRDRLSWRGGGVTILVRNDIKFDIIDTCSTTNTDVEGITIFLKNTQGSINTSTIYMPPASSIITTLIDNIKKTTDNIIITGDLSAKHTDSNCTKMGRWGIALKNEKQIKNHRTTDIQSRTKSLELNNDPKS